MKKTTYILIGMLVLTFLLPVIGIASLRIWLHNNGAIFCDDTYYYETIHNTADPSYDYIMTTYDTDDPIDRIDDIDDTDAPIANS